MFKLWKVCPKIRSTVVKRYIFSIEFLLKDHFCSFQVLIVFGRRFVYHLLTFYIPSLCFMFIAYLTMYFRLNNFQVRAIVSLTSLLVLITLNNQVSTQLPKTSYFKMIDVWLFGAMGFIFSIIVLQTVIDFFYEPKLEKQAWSKGTIHWSEKIMKLCRVILPFILIVFILIYVSIILFSK